MKANRLYIICLCAAVGLSLYACDDNESKSCEKSSECGDVNEWKCDIDTSTCVRLFPEHCTNGKTDSGETDADCGGTCVTDSKKKITCGLGKVCAADTDCGSGKCENKKCVTSGCNDLGACDDPSLTCDRATMTCISCSDQTMNGDETDVDCGGTKCDPCEAAKTCKINSDCQTGLCESGKCSATEAVDAKTGDLIINEFMANPDGTKTPKLFPYNGNAPQCKFVEIVNVSANRVKIDDCQLVVERLDENGVPVDGKTSTTKLEGTLSSKGVIIATEEKCKDISYAPGTLVVTLGNTGNITKTASYDAEVFCGSEDELNSNIGRVSVPSVPSSQTGFSMNRPEDMKLLRADDDSEMVIHSQAKGAFSFSYASPSYCANGGLLSQDCKTTCGDGTQNSDETDLDCGGSFCGPCAVGKKCASNTDCESNTCESGQCIAAKCTDDSQCSEGLKCNVDSGNCEGCGDGVQNGDESDVDCGGACSKKCDLSQKCNSGTDCATGECTENVCTGSKPEAASVDDLVINEVMGSPKSGMKFSTQQDTEQCEFVEIVNITSKKLSLENLKLSMLKIGESTTKDIELYDLIVGANSAVVIGECDSKLGPNDVSYKKATLKMTNTSGYELWLTSDDKVGKHIIRLEKTPNGESQARNPDITGVSLEFDTATPGYCRNGGLFSQNCAVDCGNAQETCGGTCQEKCGAGKHCNENSDCASDTCEGNVCADSVDPSVLIINEVFDSSSSSNSFSEINANGKACEFIEIANPTNSTVKVKNMTLVLEGTSSSDKVTTTEFDLTPADSIPSKNLLVVNNCEDLKLPSDAKSLKVDNSKIITGTWTYNISLNVLDKTSLQIKDLTIGGENKSSFNRDPDFAPNGDVPATMIKTKDVSDASAFATPGFCMNGKSYSSGCVDDPVLSSE